MASSGGKCGTGHVGKSGDPALRTLTHRNLTNAAQRHNVIVLRSFVTEAKSGNYRWQIGQFTDPAILQKLSGTGDARNGRSEEHTSELQSQMRISYAVFRLKNNN